VKGVKPGDLRRQLLDQPKRGEGLDAEEAFAEVKRRSPSFRAKKKK